VRHDPLDVERAVTQYHRRLREGFEPYELPPMLREAA
jgi:hypothetical protein